MTSLQMGMGMWFCYTPGDLRAGQIRRGSAGEAPRCQRPGTLPQATLACCTYLLVIHEHSAPGTAPTKPKISNSGPCTNPIDSELRTGRKLTA